MAKDTNILIVTEGKKDYRLMARLQELYFPSLAHLYCYQTNIYNLYKWLVNVNGDDFCGDNLLLTLRAYERDCHRSTDPQVWEILNKEYTEYSDILLIFDFDPQDPCYDPRKLDKLMKAFNDSTGNGKLYLNYPMVESFFHLNISNEIKNKEYQLKIDRSFWESTFSLDELVLCQDLVQIKMKYSTS